MKNIFKYLFLINILASILPAHAALGLMEIPENEESRPITLFYPTNQMGTHLNHGGIDFIAAENAMLGSTNAHLIIISHGSQASPWVYLSLTESLVKQGFVVAIPEHEGDNYKNGNDSGITSWKRRPQEISRALTRLSHLETLKKSIDFNQVGMYGMSAGGHAALTLAGGQWSPSKLLYHCQNNLDDDFYACAGPFSNQDSGIWGIVKNFIIQWILDLKLSDIQWYTHTDKRISSIVAGVPFAADFDPITLKNPIVHLGLINAKYDVWLQPKYHIKPIIAVCQTCEVFEIATGGHGALLSPLPEIESEAILKLIKDSPEFDRATEIPKINFKITQFFLKTLNIKYR
jgi:predicted dienelactone hydrolase